MTWEIEVDTAGRYEAIVQYTCPKGDVGSILQLKLGATTWEGNVKDHMTHH